MRTIIAGSREVPTATDLDAALIALWGGESRGTKHMIDLALQRGLRVWVQRVGVR